MGTFFQDLSYGLRGLKRNPVFAVIAVMTLALGIGANTAIFSVVNTVLLQQFPFPEPGRLVVILRGGGGSMPYAEFRDLQAQNKTFDPVVLYRADSSILTGTGDPERIPIRMISADFFKIMDVQPMAGRVFRADEDRQNAAPVALLSEGLWRRKFAADANILGKTISLSDRDYTIIGIIPVISKFFARTDVFLPIGQWDQPSFYRRGFGFNARAIGRLKPGVSLTEARAELNQVASNLAVAYPKEDATLKFSATPVREYRLGGLQQTLLLLFGAVGFVLLIACANVANLLLARSNSRTREIAIRSAMGAGRFRIVRQLLTEAVLLAAIGGALGLILAAWGTRAILAVAPAGLLGTQEVATDARVLFFTLIISIFTAVWFGILPALKSSRPALTNTLKESGRGSTGGLRRMQSLLIVSEVALAMVLLVGAGLMIRSLTRVLSVKPGYDPHNVFAFSISQAKAANPATITQSCSQLLEKMRALPGVESAAVVFGNLPLTGESDILFWREDQKRPESESDMPDTIYSAVSSEYLSAMKIPLIRGRFIDPGDSETAPLVAVIDEKMARELFPNEEPIGKRLHLTFFEEVVTIVGVAGDVKQYGLEHRDAESHQYQLYLSHRQVPQRLLSLLASGFPVVIRTAMPQLQIAAAVREQVRSLNGEKVIYGETTMDEILDGSLAFRRFTMLLMGVFAALALLLACVGVYGVISFLVGQRTREIGIRIALGAQPRDVLRLVLGRGALLQLLGVGLGIAVALPLMGLLSTMLFGVTPRDPLTFAAVAFLLIVVGLVACFIPARRASRLDPLVALRYE